MEEFLIFSWAPSSLIKSHVAAGKMSDSCAEEQHVTGQGRGWHQTWQVEPWVHGGRQQGAVHLTERTEIARLIKTKGASRRFSRFNIFGRDGRANQWVTAVCAN